MDHTWPENTAGHSTARQTWSKSWDFLFAVVGSSVGLGNLWRFPYLCYKYGGGAFLIPYTLFAIFMGIPLVILDTSLGQSMRKGLTKCWGIVPIWKGIAFGQLIILVHASVSYPILLVWALKYFISSCSSVLPWSTCDNDWNTGRCVTPNMTSSIHVGANMTKNSTLNKQISSGEEFWNFKVLAISKGVDHMGGLRSDLALLLAVLWVATYFCTFKGINWTSKVVYVTVTLPMIFIVVIAVVATLQEGAMDGIRFYLKPDLGRLKEFTVTETKQNIRTLYLMKVVWAEAGSQVMYSYSIANGTLATLGSYNKKTQNFWRDAFLIAFFNTATSFLSGFAIFSAIGFMANYQNITVPQVATTGPGLAFIAYPETLSLLPLPQFWCALFFLTVLLLGFDTQFVQQECAVSFLIDWFPQVRAFRFGRELFHAAFALVAFLLGLIMVTEGGVYVFEIYNLYALAGWCKALMAFFELMAIGWFYGMDRYWDEMTDMIGERRGKLWIKVTWKYTGPVICLIMVAYYIATTTVLSYGKYIYPPWAQAVAHMLSWSSTAFVPGYAIYKLINTWKRGGDFKQLFHPRSSLQMDKMQKSAEEGSKYM